MYKKEQMSENKDMEILSSEEERIVKEILGVQELISLLGTYFNYLKLRAFSLKEDSEEGRTHFKNKASLLLKEIIIPFSRGLNENADVFNASMIEKSLRSLDTEDSEDFEDFYGEVVNHKGEGSEEENNPNPVTKELKLIKINLEGKSEEGIVKMLEKLMGVGEVESKG